MKTKFFTLLLSIVAVVTFASEGIGQNEDPTVIAFKEAVTKSVDRITLHALSMVSLESGVTRAITDCSNVTSKLSDFVDYAGTRIKGPARPGGYKQDLLLDIIPVIQMEAKTIAVFDRGIAMIPANTPPGSIKRAEASMTKSRISVINTFATIYSTAATLRTLDHATDRMKAMLSKTPVDTAKHTAANKAALADMNRAIELNPTKSYYEKRSRIHKDLGNTAEAATDMTKAATMTL